MWRNKWSVQAPPSSAPRISFPLVSQGQENPEEGKKLNLTRSCKELFKQPTLFSSRVNDLNTVDALGDEPSREAVGELGKA